MTAGQRTDWRAVDDGTRYWEVGVGPEGRAPELTWTGMARGRAEARTLALSSARQAWSTASVIAGEDPAVPPALLSIASLDDAEPELAQGCELRGIVRERFMLARERRQGPWTADEVGDVAMAAISTAASRAIMPPGKTVLLEYGPIALISGETSTAAILADATLASGDDIDEGRELGSLPIPPALRSAITAISVAQAALSDDVTPVRGVSWPESKKMAALHQAAIERTADDDANKVAVFLGQAGLGDEALLFLHAFGRRAKP